MKRPNLVILLTILLTSIFSNIINKSLASANVDNFYFESMSVHYKLGKDSEGRSTLRVSEKLVPIFPNFDQNRGIVRVIPLTYNGHSLSFELESVFRDNLPANIYESSVENQQKKLIIRDASDKYLHGEHKYQINYTLRDVTQKPDNANINEFYWDVNGTGWSQSFMKVEARITLDDGLENDLINEQFACYTGQFNSQMQDCEIYYDPGTKEIVSSTNNSLNPNETLTVALGFKQGTFSAYQKSNQEKLIEKVPLTLTYAGVLLTGLGFYYLKKLKKSAKVRKPIVTQFLPPKNSDIHLNVGLINRTQATTATLLDLAVNHKLRILEKNGLFEIKKFSFEVTNTDKLTENDREFLKIYFSKEPINGDTYTFKSTDYLTGLRSSAYYGNTTKSLIKAGIFIDNKNAKKPANGFLIAGLALCIAAFILNIAFTSSDTILIDKISFIPLLISAIAIIGLFLANLPRLTEAGADIKAHLLGLREYILRAEDKRLDFAQSVEGAQRELEKDLAINQSKDSLPSSKIILYERLLPYAALFGFERSWAKQLEIAYTKEPAYTPTWYIGSHAFNANNFAKSISSFSNSVASSSSSSSSSGSGGGGSAGGGGGGGGGGGA